MLLRVEWLNGPNLAQILDEAVCGYTTELILLSKVWINYSSSSNW